MSDKYDPIAMAKGILWEEAKGKLRALVAVDGSRISPRRHVGEKARFEVVSDAVESFIGKFEGEGLHE